MSTPEKPSALEKVRSLRAQADKLMADAKAEAIEKAEKAVAELNELGFTYRLIEGEEPLRRVREKTVTRQKRDVPCPICQFKTDPPHDGRRHRSQPEPKKPFTAAELKNLDMEKVE